MNIKELIIYFFAFSLIILMNLIIKNNNMINILIYLAISYVILGLIFILINNIYLGLSYIILYVGSIIVLILFTIMLLNLDLFIKQ
jgi:NADH-quinone oxidoreductase subunit J